MMPAYVPVSREHHGTKRWRRPSSYAFAATHIFAPLLPSELAHAVLSFPVGFVAQGDDFVLGAVLGLRQGENLLVAPDGRWLGAYVPAAFRSYPFVALPAKSGGEEIFCVDEESGLVGDGPEGERFFDDDGALSGFTREILSFLAQAKNEFSTTREVCKRLRAVIKPWEISFQGPSGDHQVVGFFRIDEQAFNLLPESDLLAIRAAGGLPVVYGQLFSMLHLTALSRAAAARAQAGAIVSQLPGNELGELDLEFLNTDQTLNYGQLK